MTTFGSISYATVAVAYFFLGVLLAFSWKGRPLGGWLIACFAVTCLWGSILGLQSSFGAFSSTSIFLIEVGRSAVWIIFLAKLSSAFGVPRSVLYIAHATWVGTLIAGSIHYLIGIESDSYGGIGGALIPGGLLMALAGLVLIEQLYRNSPADARPAIKFLAFSVGTVLAYDLFLYSQAVLFSTIDQAIWNFRGVVTAMALPLLAVAAQRSPRWDLNIFISRQVVFFSTTLVAVGGYLLLMSLGGYYVLMFGGTWGILFKSYSLSVRLVF